MSLFLHVNMLVCFNTSVPKLCVNVTLKGRTFLKGMFCLGCNLIGLYAFHPRVTNVCCEKIELKPAPAECKRSTKPSLVHYPLQNTRLASSENQSALPGKAAVAHKPGLRPRAALGEIGNNPQTRQALRKKVNAFCVL